MPDFNKGSTFNKDANFQGVKFGADAPLLETELNELQDIQTEARAEIIRDSIPSGFVKLGELDYDYMLNNENCVKLKTDSVAYVNGYKILIPKDTIVDIGKAPEKDAREDLLFLEVWKEEVTKDSVLTVAGGEGQAQISNAILDDRVGQETARRIALKWRIRHVADVDFSHMSMDGLATKYGYGWDDSLLFYPSRVQGGNESPIPMTLTSAPTKSMTSFCTPSINNTTNLNDVGLFIAGRGDNSSKSILKTIDGYVYAIPMFKLYRKPSCGKAIPFEYQKINPQVDYSKFADLMKEEKVERVVNETIQGQSLVNLLPPVSEFGGVGITNLGNNTVKLTQTGTTEYFQKRGLNFKNNTVYTFIYTIVESTVVDNSFCIVGDSDENILDAIHQISSKVGVNCYSFTSSNTNINPSKFRLAINSIATEGTYVIFKDIMLLEGDWTNKEIPEHFTGLKSLGEDEGNLITVKNAILNESSYDPDTGTPKLSIIDGVNYITSDNLIMPTFEAQVKRGETKLSDLNSFDKVDNMAGDEVVEFTKIKGRTLQNLITNKAWTINSSGANAYMSMNWELLKPNTNYTYFVINPSPKMNLTKGYVGNRFVTYSSLDISKPVLLTTITDFSVVTGTSYPHVYPIDDSLLTRDDLANVKLLLLEGDWTDVPLDQIPYVEGIKSVGENEDNKVVVKRTGKNLINLKNININPNYKLSLDIEKGSITCNDNSTYNDIQFYVKLYKGKTYKISMRGLTLGSGNFNILKGKQKGYVPTEIANVTITKYGGQFTFNDNTGYYTLHVPNIRNTVSDIILVEGAETNGFEPYKEYIQEITLKEPLRSLPNGVCDTIEGNKVIRRVGKIVLDGSEGWQTWNGTTEQTNTLPFMLNNILPNGAKNIDSSIRFISDKFPSYGSPGSLNNVDSDGFTSHNSIYIRISKSKLATQDTTGFKTWLSQNPTTVYYELANPVEELIEPNYDKESIKTYQLDQPLRSLPNGVKDEIVGNKLIRRCGEIILNGGEAWSLRSEALVSDTLLFQCTYTPMKRLSSLYCDRFLQIENDLWSQNIEGIRVYQTSDFFHIRINKSKLSSPDATGFKAWLKANPVKVIYELATPIEIPLKEVLSSRADFSLERQFKYSDNYLLELPNGVKDTVENGKVTRRVGKITLNGSEDWLTSSNNISGYINFYTTTKRFMSSNVFVSRGLFNKYMAISSASEMIDRESIYSWTDSLNVEIRILADRLSSADVTGFKAWLSANPITVLYELNTPTTEELSGNNNMYCPRHEINTYCGSMYVGDGTNNVLVENGLKNENVIIDTPFRSITDKEVVTDCKYKKSVDGYDTSYITSNGNLLDDSVYKGFKLKEAKIHFQPVRLTPGKYSLRIVFTDGTVVPNSNVCIFIFDEKKLPIMGLATNGVLYVDWEVAKKGKYLVLARNDMGISAYGEKVIQNIIVAKSETFVMDISDYSPIEKAFENTEENDIEDLRHLTSLVGFNYEQILNESFDSLLRGEL